MANVHSETVQTNCDSKPVYIYDEKLGWVNVTLFLDNLKRVMNIHTKSIKKDFNLIRLYYSSC